MAYARYEAAKEAVLETVASAAKTVRNSAQAVKQTVINAAIAVKNAVAFLYNKLCTYFVKLCGLLFGCAAVVFAAAYAGWYIFTTAISTAIAIGIGTKVLNTFVLPQDQQIDARAATQYAAASVASYGMQAFNYVQPVMFSAGEYVGQSAATLALNTGEVAANLAIQGTGVALNKIADRAHDARQAIEDRADETIAAAPSLRASVSNYVYDSMASIAARVRRFRAA